MYVYVYVYVCACMCQVMLISTDYCIDVYLSKQQFAFRNNV